MTSPLTPPIPSRTINSFLKPSISYSLTPCSEIMAMYPFLSTHTKGTQGKIIKVTFDDTIYALKLQEVDPRYDLNEYQLLPTLLSLAPYTSSISYPIDYFLTTNNCYQQKPSDDNTLLFITISPFLSYQFRELITLLHRNIISNTAITLSKHQRYNYIRDRMQPYERGFIFELTVALILLHQHHIVHGDINAANIMFAPCSLPRLYSINNIDFIVETEYIPVFIDFGRCYTSYNNDDFVPDWLNTLSLFSDNNHLYERYSLADDTSVFDSYFQPLQITPDPETEYFSYQALEIM